MRIALCLLSAIILAGCSSAEPKVETTDATTSVLSGIVVDAAIVPVPGANVTMGARAVVTDDDGGFTFGQVDAGTVMVNVSKDGFVPSLQQVRVDGDTRIQVVLARLQTDQAYVLAQQQAGFIACEAIVVNIVESCDGGTQAFGQPRVELFFPIDPLLPEAYQAEVVWSHTQELGRRLTTTHGACYEGTYCSPYNHLATTICQTWGQSPLWCRANATDIERSGGGTSGLGTKGSGLGLGTGPGIAVAMGADCTVCTPAATPECADACGIGAAAQQDFDVYVHVFYHRQPPADWLFSRDGAP